MLVDFDSVLNICIGWHDYSGNELNDEKLFGVENVDRNSLVTAVGAAAGAGLAQELHVNDANQAAAKPLSVAGDSYLPDTSSLGDEDDDEEVEEDDGGGQAVNSGLSGLSLGGSSDVTPNPLSAGKPSVLCSMIEILFTENDSIRLGRPLG